MTVKVTKPALNLREELAKGTQKYTQQQFWFDNLVTNGTFDSDLSGWTANGGGSWDATGAARVEDIGGSDGSIIQSISTEVGKSYTITLVITDRNTTVFGSHRIRIGSTYPSGYDLGQPYLDDVPLNEVFSYTFTATTTTTWITYLHSYSNTYSVVNNISVFESDGTDVIHRLPLGWKPLHVYEDGLIQREGDANDYTVVKTGDSYSVKPAVAPSASTQTCVIAELEL